MGEDVDSQQSAAIPRKSIQRTFSPRTWTNRTSGVWDNKLRDLVRHDLIIFHVLRLLRLPTFILNAKKLITLLFCLARLWSVLTFILAAAQFLRTTHSRIYKEILVPFSQLSSITEWISDLFDWKRYNMQNSLLRLYFALIMRAARRAYLVQKNLFRDTLKKKKMKWPARIAPVLVSLEINANFRWIWNYSFDPLSGSSFTIPRFNTHSVSAGPSLTRPWALSVTLTVCAASCVSVWSLWFEMDIHSMAHDGVCL